jgi:hypothetical protein
MVAQLVASQVVLSSTELDSFPIQNGLKQGDALSPFFFSTLL